MVSFAHIARWRLLAGLIILLATVLLHTAQLPVRLSDGPAASSYSYDHKLMRPQATDSVALVERDGASLDPGGDFLAATSAELSDLVWFISYDRAEFHVSISLDLKPWAARAPPAMRI